MAGVAGVCIALCVAIAAILSNNIDLLPWARRLRLTAKLLAVIPAIYIASQNTDSNETRARYWDQLIQYTRRLEDIQGVSLSDSLSHNLREAQRLKNVAEYIFRVGNLHQAADSMLLAATLVPRAQPDWNRDRYEPRK